VGQNRSSIGLLAPQKRQTGIRALCIKDPQFADEAIRQNRVDLVAVGRAILADPDWALNAAKALSRRAADRDHGDKTVTKRT
jgi:2,4-dienoyl-CoA reductase-like NADH-dependent reductase (Old Yellow Enzyme family)